MMNKSIYFLLTLFILSACAPAVYVETDKVTKTRFVKCEMFFANDDFREPSYWQKVMVVKEEKQGGAPQYNWFDVITLSVENFEIDLKDIYLIIDDEIFPLTNSYEKLQGKRNVNENRQDVMKSDSTKVSVVTGYDVVQKNVYQMTHPVSAEIMNRILDAQEVTIRYKVGPQFINSEIKYKNLDNLKKMITE